MRKHRSCFAKSGRAIVGVGAAIVIVSIGATVSLCLLHQANAGCNLPGAKEVSISKSADFVCVGGSVDVTVTNVSGAIGETVTLAVASGSTGTVSPTSASVTVPATGVATETFTAVSPGTVTIEITNPGAVGNCSVTFTIIRVDLVGHEPWTMSAPAIAVSETDEDVPQNLITRTNDDEDDGGPAEDNDDTTIGASDDDIVQVTLKQFDPSLTEGTMELTVTGASDIQLFESSGASLLSDYSVDLATPSGELAGLASGDVNLYLEGMDVNADVVLKLAYKDTSGTEICSDELHLTIIRVDLVEYKRATATSYEELTDGTVLLRGQAFDFKAIITPGIAPFPSSVVEWSGTFGTSGNGETVSHTYAGAASASDTDYKTLVVCDKSINVIVSDKVLGIHSDSDPASDVWVNPGHAWVSLTDYSSLSIGTLTTYGLCHSSATPSPLALYAPGTDLYVDREYSYTPHADGHNRYYLLLPSQFVAFENWLDEDHDYAWSGLFIVPPTYNCASFASDTIAEVVGLDVDADDSLGFETPRELSQSIDALESTDPTTDYNPALVGGGGSGGSGSWVWP